MKEENTYKLRLKDEKIVKIFTVLGMPRNLAKTLMYISNVKECRSADIEHGAKLRQPEVSVAMKKLQSRGWISKRDLKKKGKGRPVHIYKLTSPIDKIVANFEKEKIKEIDTIKGDLDKLKNLI
jgi:predicted transcriptional regulator